MVRGIDWWNIGVIETIVNNYNYRKDSVMEQEKLISEEIHSEPEKQIVRCKVCNKDGIRIHNGFYPNKKDKKWLSVDGREYNGRVCPPCNSNKKAVYQKSKRRLEKSLKEHMEKEDQNGQSSSESWS